MDQTVQQSRDIKMETFTAGLVPYPDGKKVSYGFLCVVSGQKSYINSVYKDKNCAGNAEANEIETVIFDSTKVKIIPKDGPVNTWKNVYLVRYVKYRKNPNIPGARKSVDFQYPVEVLHSFSREEYSLLYIEGDVLKARGKQSKELQPAGKKNTLTAENIQRLDEVLNQIVTAKGTTTGSYFPILARQAGIANFRDYADNVSAFLKTYLPNYVYYDKAVLNRKSYQDLIVKANSPVDREIQEHNSPLPLKPVNEPLELITLDELDALYEAGAWVSFLSSPVLRKIPPAKLPDKYFEMAVNCAEQLLYGDQAQNIQLNKFQRQLFTAESTAELVKGWKSSSMPETILNQCLEGCLEENSSAHKLINRIGYTNGHNTAWRGIRTRFVACKNVLIPHIFLINAYAAPKDDIITEFCTMIKSWDESYRKKALAMDRPLEAFRHFLSAYDKYILQGTSFENRHCTAIFSVYLDIRRPDRLLDALNIFDPDKDSHFLLLMDLIEHGDTWTAERFSLLSSEVVSKKLLVKCIAVLWDRYRDPGVYQGGLMCILAWLLRDFGSAELDEVLHLHYSSEYTKLDKRVYLLSQLCQLSKEVSEEPTLYALGSYIYYEVYPHLSNTMLTPENTSDIEQWAVWAESYFQEKLQLFDQLTQDNEAQFLALVDSFRYDPPRHRLFQEHYADWFSASTGRDIPETQVTEVLGLLKQNNAHIAYIRTFNACTEDSPHFLTQSPLLFGYADSMTAMDQHAELVDFANGCGELPDDCRTELLIRALSENFRSYGLESRAFTLFTENFTEDDAIALLLKRMTPIRPGVINSLIALYAHRKEYSKAHYLALIFRKRTEVGFRKLFTHFFSVAAKFGRYYQKESNHFDAISLALRTLDPDALLDFLRIAAQIKIPEYKDYDQNHIYAHLYNVLLSDPVKPKPWSVLLQHSIKNIEHNIWNVVVCERVLRKQFGNASSTQSGFCINKLLQESKIKDLPYNLLPYVCMYIMDTNDRKTIELLVQLFHQEEFVAHVVTNNPWNEGHSKIWSQFTQYCLGTYIRTQDNLIYSLIQLAGMPLRTDAINTVKKSNQDKRYLFKQICDHYLNGMALDEMADILNDSDWEYLSKTDTQMLKVLRSLYADNEYFLTEYAEIYPDAESVCRMKQDCALILREYPSKKQLYEFDGNCTNLAHKFLVYSLVIPVLYDEEIVDRCWTAWTMDIQDERTWRAYYVYREASFLTQLDVNAVYETLYKRYRYLKLYINMVCQRGVEGDDSFIISAMEQHQHMEQIYDRFYVPMKRDMVRFMQISGLSKEAKRRFLEGLVNGPMDIFLKHHHVELEMLPSDDKTIMRRMLEPMDWRCANEYLYLHYWDELQKGSYAPALAAAEAFSVYAYDTLLALRDGMPGQLGDIDYYGFLVEEKGKKIKSVLDLPQDVFVRNKAFLIPALCSRVFQHRLLATMRYNILQHAKFSDRYQHILDYLTQKGSSDTAKAFHYLRALHACIQKDRKTVKQILSEHNLTSGIPSLWDNEAEHIIKYASGRSEKFIWDSSITDVSKIGTRKNTHFPFVKWLSKKLDIEQTPLGIEMLKDLYDQFGAAEKDCWNKMHLGIQLLSGYGRDRTKMLQEESDIPSYNRLAIEVGMIAIGNDTNLPVDEKVAVATDLYIARELFRKMNMEQQLMVFYERFRDLLCKQLNLGTWIRYADSIREFLKNVNDEQDFSEICEWILTPCSAYMEPMFPLEDRANGLRRLLDVFRNMPSTGSPYARDVERAIGAELRRLADGTCLRVNIVNVQDTITDGCVYFQIENVGKRTASLRNDNITVLIRSDNEREHTVSITDIEDLRSGFVTGGSHRLHLHREDRTIEVSIRIVQHTSHGEQNLCSTAKKLIWSGSEKKLAVRKGNEYEVGRAVSQERLLYGREKDKEDLSWCVPQGVTVIYGPSRIGKTSLLNWVQNDLAKKQGNVMTLLYGGEKAAYKFSDWSNKNYADDTNVIPYDDDRKMSEYLLSDTIIHGLDKSTRFSEPGVVKVEKETLDEIRHIMQKNTYLIERYYELDKYLAGKGLELWLLLDEFQQIVQHWNISSGCDFHSVCDQISDDIHNIKLVLCGSDELLKHMVLKRSSEWKSVLQGCKTHQVEPLDRTHFEQMICEEPSLAGTNIHYTQSALRALFDYTDGVALYGKEICNALLRDIQSVPEDYSGRNAIYISDIAKMTQRLLNDQADELSTKMKETISKIYKEVTKNLDTDTNNILWYIARWLDENPQEDGFDERVLYDSKLHISNQTLEESLTIARARGIIRAKSKAGEHQGIYVFRTLFYYFAFLGSAPRMTKLEEVLIADTAEENEIITEKTRLDDLVENFKLVDNKRTALQTLYANMEPEEQEKYLKGVAPRNMATTMNFAENIQINSQTINNTFHTLLAGPVDAASFVKALAGMPTLSGYLDEGQREPLNELVNNALYAESPEEMETIQHNIQAITAPAEEEMLSDTLGAVVRTEGFLDVDEPRWISLLGLSGHEEYNRLRELPPEFFAPLGFAVMLHNIFQRIEDNAPEANRSDMDFCPVAIMYCKVVENLLKKLHTPIYVHRIGHIATIKKGVYFDTLLGKDGVTISDTKDLSIGSFSVNIARTPFSNHVDERRRFKVTPRTDTIPKLVGTTGSDVHQRWCDHAWTLSVIRAIRNKSAHEAAPITRENFDWLIEELFQKGGLLRIAELAKKTPV